MNTFIIIPAFNESRRIEKVLQEIKNINTPIVVIDDGSQDSTYKVSKKYKITLLKHRINLGKGAALKTGIEAAILMGAEAMILMDADGQHKTSEISKFIEKIESNNYDVVFGSRNLGMGVPLVRFIGNKIASVLISFLFGIYISDSLCGFRAITKKGYEGMNLVSSGYDIELEMIVKTKKAKLKYCEIPVETVYYDKFKGVTIMDAFSILFNVLKWKISR